MFQDTQKNNWMVWKCSLQHIFLLKQLRIGSFLRDGPYKKAEIFSSSLLHTNVKNVFFSPIFPYCRDSYIPGTKTVSPGFCKISRGLNSGGQVGSCVLGYMTLNQVIASSCWFPPSSRVTLISSLGVLVGNRHHRLWPWTKAFHALVPKGSMWIPVPERGGPITNHLRGGDEIL